MFLLICYSIYTFLLQNSKPGIAEGTNTWTKHLLHSGENCQFWSN